MKNVCIMFYLFCFSLSSLADERSAGKHFEKIQSEPTLLRHFLFKLPKGGDLHHHLDGGIYAENFIDWAAADGKCVNLESWFITAPPCDTANGTPPVSDIQYDFPKVNRLIDALSVRNYEKRELSGHQKFFTTFRRFFEAGLGHEGHMLAEVSARAARQNIVYLELMQSWGMAEARALAKDNPAFSIELPLSNVAANPAMDSLVDATIENLDQIEQQWRDKLACGSGKPDPGCDVPVRYLAQVIRVFPPEQVLAQTILAFKLIERDPRIVGLNFVAPEDNPISLRDYHWQMQMIGGLGEIFPTAKKGITLHAGEVVLGLVPPEHLGWHIREAIEIAGARRIGHGIDVFYDPKYIELMEHMAEQDIMVEINLTSNDVILGVSGDRHPFSAYRKYNVPMAFSTDDEGVSRIDLTHEYQRAVETYSLSYKDLKYFSRNALAYSFIAGESLLDHNRRDGFVEVCEKSRPGKKIASASCQHFLEENEKAHWQWNLEERFYRFESEF
jgi:adenosine deaminase